MSLDFDFYLRKIVLPSNIAMKEIKGIIKDL